MADNKKSLKWRGIVLRNLSSKEFRPLIPSWNALYIDIYLIPYIPIHTLYIAINRSWITVDKYSALLTMRHISELQHPLPLKEVSRVQKVLHG